MKIFISSLISGYEDLRAAAVAAVRSLGYEPVTAETFDASLTSPRIACLQGVRTADLVVMILGGVTEWSSRTQIVPRHTRMAGGKRSWC